MAASSTLLRVGAFVLWFALALAAFAQPRQREARIGVVYYRTPLKELQGPQPESPTARALLMGLREKGWVDGGGARIYWRSGIEHAGGIPGAVEELVRLPVDILVVAGNDIAAEVAKRNPKLPVVMASSDFPVENGLVASYARPGGSITGLTNWVGKSLNAKRLALLKEAAPQVRRVAVIGPPSASGGPLDFSSETRSAADALGLELVSVPLNRSADLERAFAQVDSVHADGIFVVDYPFAFVRAHQEALCELAARRRLPAIHSASTAASAGALITYGPDIAENFRRAGHLVDKILRGANPGEIPIEDPAKLELVVSLRAARAIGLTLPQSILTQASRVVD